jgi:hypothetical protein
MSLWLAIGLLLLQAAVTAGHFHPEDFSVLAGRTQAFAAVADQGRAPPADQPALPAHADCSLCFSLQLAGGSILPELVRLAVPQQLGGVARPPLDAFHLTPAPYLLFRTRAPPVA